LEGWRGEEGNKEDLWVSVGFRSRGGEGREPPRERAIDWVDGGGRGWVWHCLVMMMAVCLSVSSLLRSPSLPPSPLLVRYDPDTRISETIESENDRVEFIMNITQVGRWVEHSWMIE